jgi:hypothetical protein
MTQKEIKQAAKEYHYYETNLESTFIAGANFVNERQPYTAKDMVQFHMWMETFGHNYIRKIAKHVVQNDELLKLWEKSK